MTTHRINLNMKIDTLEVIDAFAKMNGRSRTYVIEELLAPSIPALKQLLKLSDELKTMSDADRLTALAKMTNTEEKLKANVRAMPQHIEGLSQ